MQRSKVVSGIGMGLEPTAEKLYQIGSDLAPGLLTGFQAKRRHVAIRNFGNLSDCHICQALPFSFFAGCIGFFRRCVFVRQL